MMANTQMNRAGEACRRMMTRMMMNTALAEMMTGYPYRKHKLVCGCYKIVDKVNYNLVATLPQGCDNLVSTL